MISTHENRKRRNTMSEKNVFIKLIKKSVGLPTGKSSCCGAPAQASIEAAQGCCGAETSGEGSCCGTQETGGTCGCYAEEEEESCCS
jgi:hypothetical protein